jgi:pyruvate,water dikinase
VQHLYDLGEIAPEQRPRLGVKAVNLGRLLRAGLPVPPGFCLDDEIDGGDPAIAVAFRALGGLVAVRSSVAGEDESDAAGAGIYATSLGIGNAANLAVAIDAVRRSSRAAHVRTYQPGRPAPRVAVIVQRLVEADVAGVVFSRDPKNETAEHLAVAAAWGLGTTVVGGAAADRFTIDRTTGQSVEQVITHKAMRETSGGPEPVVAENADIPCLTSAELQDLATLAVDTETAFGEPCDVEWALAGGRFWLLQARPITSSPTRDIERVREQEIERLRRCGDAHGTVWVRYHLAESAPHPTPMTWAVLQSMLSVGGGYGRMLRGLGFDPDPHVDEIGFVQLIAGQPYLNLNLEARLDHRDIPYSIDVRRLKCDPGLALVPQRTLLAGRTPAGFWLRLPAIVWRAWRQTRRLRRLRDSYARDLSERVFPAFADDVRQARAIELAAQSTDTLLALFDEWRRRTLVEFAGSALQPAVYANIALQEITAGADQDERERRLAHLNVVLSAAERSTETDQPAALRAFVDGSLDMATFLDRFGHRGPEELELAQPRWRELPPDVQWSADRGARTPKEKTVVPLRDSRSAVHRTDAVQRYCEAVALRENGRHFFMLGYSYLRDILLELDRRFQLAGGVFYLRPNEFDSLVKGTDMSAHIRSRRRECNLRRGLAVPAVLFGDDLEAIGRPPERAMVSHWTGRPISVGIGEGPAVVAAAPEAVVARRGHVLVCPYVDAAWLPVLVNAAAVILETGTDLSHGAILLRELGIPAVAGVPGVMTQVVPGERLRVDGRRGEVARVGRDSAEHAC